MFQAQNAQITFSIDFAHMKGTAIPSSLFIFAHYRKLSRLYCQHVWMCGNCHGRGCKKCEGKGENYPSVEGAVKSAFGPAFGASDVCLHASGREDVDVITEGNGRPCVIEIVHPAKRNACISAVCESIRSSHPIELIGAKICPPSWVEAICTSHFEKKYRVWVDGGREVTDGEIAKIAESAPVLLLQRTPVRVSQRRSDMVRKRRVKKIEIVSHSGSEFVLDLTTDAGTYIKEFVHGDGGRTVPSLSSILGSNASCKQLNVIGIYDEFISTLWGG
jgi:tRNA pseudouridine synthase 10